MDVSLFPLICLSRFCLIWNLTLTTQTTQTKMCNIKNFVRRAEVGLLRWRCLKVKVKAHHVYSATNRKLQL